MLWGNRHAVLSLLLARGMAAETGGNPRDGEVKMQIMAVRILREKKPGNVAFPLKKTHWENWWFVVVYHVDRARKYAHARHFTRKLAKKLRQVIQTYQARVGAN